MTPLHAFADHRFSLPELVSAAVELCGRLRAQADERVRQLPDERTIRYYQSVGLVDRPHRYDGRTAVYGYRHLLQAVAVKALQGEGLSLARVQAALAGADTDVLERAVAEAIGSTAATPAGPSTATALAPTPAPQPLLTYRIAPGVWVTIDPAQVPDAQTIVDSLSCAINPRSSS